MFFTASSTFWPSRRTPRTTRSEIDVAFLSSRTRTTVPSRINRTMSSSARGRFDQASQSVFTFRQMRLTASLSIAPLNSAASARRTPPPQRYSAKRKLRVVSRLLRGEPLELLARELNVTAARLSEWRDRALLAAEAALKERNSDDRDDEIVRLKGKVGEMTMGTELLREKIARLEAGAFGTPEVEA